VGALAREKLPLFPTKFGAAKILNQSKAQKLKSAVPQNHLLRIIRRSQEIQEHK